MKNKTQLFKALTRACALFALAAISAPTSRAAIQFTSANITDLAGDVTTYPSTNPTAKTPAKLNDLFQAPNFMETGRKSRVQLTAGDGTIARVGSNTLFSLEASSSTVHLTSGSVLFSAPKGITSSIVTNSATATVEGFTVIASATTDGGFKLLVLEGTATIKLPNGQTVTLTPGQMTYILPASKGGGVGPILNFDLKKEAQSSGLVNGFTLSLPSQNLIVDAINQQQLKISAGQLTPTGQVAVGAVSADQVFLVDSTTFDNVQNVNNPPTTTNSPDLVLGPTAGLALPAANTFVSPGQTFTAGQLGLPNGVISGDQITVTGLVGGNVSASGIVDLSSLDGLPKMGILAQKTFAFTSVFTNISLIPALDTPAGSFFSNSTAAYITNFSELQTTLHLILTAKDGFTFNPSTEIYADFGPPVFANLSSFTVALATPTLASPTITSVGSQFRTNFKMTSLLADLNASIIDIFNPTGNLKLQSIVGDVNLNVDFIEPGYSTSAGGNTTVQSKLGAVNLDGTAIFSGNSSASSTFINAGTNVSITSGVSSYNNSTIPAFVEGNTSNGTLQISARGDVTADSNSTIEGFNENIFAGGVLTLNNANVNHGFFGTYVYGGNTVSLSNINLSGAANVFLYSALGVLNINGTVIPGDVNFLTGVQYNGTAASGHVGVGGPGEEIVIGRTADNPAVQTALGAATTLGSTPPPSNQIFSNVLFTPEEAGESVGDNYFFIANGVLAGAITASGNVDLTGVPTLVVVDIAAYNGFAINGNTTFTLPSLSNNTGLRLESRLGFIIAPGSVITNNLAFNFSSGYAFEMDSLPSTTFNNVTILSPNSSVNVASAEGSLTFNGGAINSGNFGGGGVNLVSFGAEGSVTVAGASITGNSFSGGSDLIQADNVVVESNSTITGSTVTLAGGTVGVTVADSSLTSVQGPINVTSDTDIGITNSTLQSNSTPVTSSFTNGRVNLTAAHIVTVVNSTLITPRPVILAGQAINLNGVSMSNSTVIDMQARTINLSNINFPGSSTVNLTSQNGLLAPNPNTSAASVVGDVNFITNVMYGGSPAQNFVPTAVGGSSSSSETNKININSSTFH